MKLNELVKSVYGITAQNVYVDLNGAIRPHKFPASGLWHFDGQVFYQKKNLTVKIESTPSGENYFYKEWHKWKN